jgi:hypothetical protein
MRREVARLLAHTLGVFDDLYREHLARGHLRIAKFCGRSDFQQVGCTHAHICEARRSIEIQDSVSSESVRTNPAVISDADRGI